MQIPCRPHAKPMRNPCNPHAESMLNQCNIHAESTQKTCIIYAGTLQLPCRTHAAPMQTTRGFSFAAFAPQLDDELASPEALELLLPRKLATCFRWRPALARLLAAWASSLRTFSTTESRRAAGPVAYAACFSRRRCKARAFSGSDSGAALLQDNHHPGSPVGHTRRRIGARRAP